MLTIAFHCSLITSHNLNELHFYFTIEQLLTHNYMFQKLNRVFRAVQADGVHEIKCVFFDKDRIYIFSKFKIANLQLRTAV